MKPEITGRFPQTTRKSPQLFPQDAEVLPIPATDQRPVVRNNDTLFYAPAPVDVGKAIAVGGVVLIGGGVVLTAGAVLVTVRLVSLVGYYGFFVLSKVFEYADKYSDIGLTSFLEGIMTTGRNINTSVRPDATAGNCTHIQTGGSITYNIDNRNGGNIQINH